MINDILIVGLVAAVLAGVAASVYFWTLFAAEPGSRLARALAVASTAVNVASAWIGFLAARRLLGEPSLEGSIPYTVAAIIVLELSLVYVAFELRRSRQANRRRIIKTEKHRDALDAAREVRRDTADAQRETSRDASDAAREVRHEDVLKGESDA